MEEEEKREKGMSDSKLFFQRCSFSGLSSRAPLPSLLATRACDVREREAVEALEGREGGMCVVSEEHELSRMSRERSERESKMKFEQQRMRREKKPEKKFLSLFDPSLLSPCCSLFPLFHIHTSPFQHTIMLTALARRGSRGALAALARSAARGGEVGIVFAPPSISVAIENKCFHSHAFFSLPSFWAFWFLSPHRCTELTK
jgi:hypothetical protein